jgi:nicotinate-nucleotide adenylyltransferase
MRIGVLGGTFDPPHYGHLNLAEQARDQLHLDRVLWVPAAVPPHKQGATITPVEARLSMLQLALAGNSAFEISRVDIDRPGPHYSVDMLELLAGQNPQTELCFLIGGDSLRDLPTWHEPARLLRLVVLVVMRRPGAVYELEGLEQSIPGVQAHTLFLHAPMIDISARDIRCCVADGRSIRYLLPDSVIEFIAEHRLYTKQAIE